MAGFETPYYQYASHFSLDDSIPFEEDEEVQFAAEKNGNALLGTSSAFLQANQESIESDHSGFSIDSLLNQAKKAAGVLQTPEREEKKISLEKVAEISGNVSKVAAVAMENDLFIESPLFTTAPHIWEKTVDSIKNCIKDHAYIHHSAVHTTPARTQHISAIKGSLDSGRESFSTSSLTSPLTPHTKPLLQPMSLPLTKHYNAANYQDVSTPGHHTPQPVPSFHQPTSLDISLEFETQMVKYSNSVSYSHQKEQVLSSVEEQTSASKTRSQRCVKHKAGQSVEDMGAPIDSSRLKSIRQKTKNVVVNILEDGNICLEFTKKKGKVEKVVEVLRISPDGLMIGIYQPNGGNGCAVQNTPPALPSDDSVQYYSFSELPAKYLKRYQYAARFISLVRSKTPKVTMYTKQAKCILMENCPDADFEVMFYKGGKFSRSCDSTRIVHTDGSTVNIKSDNETQNLTAESRQIWLYSKECQKKCIELEAMLSSMQDTQGEFSFFPVIVGRRPADSADVDEMKTSTPINQRSLPACDNHTSPISYLSWDQSMMSQTSTPVSKPRHQRQSYPEVTQARYCPEVTQARYCPEVTQPRYCPELTQARYCPELTQARYSSHIQPSSLNQAPSMASSTASGRSIVTVLCKVFVPSIGWGLQLSNGAVMIKFSDHCDLVINSSPMVVHFTDSDGTSRKYEESDMLPQIVHQKLELLPLIMDRLNKAQTPIHARHH